MQYEKVRLSIVEFAMQDMVKTSWGDNVVPEIPDPDGEGSGGIFG